MQGGNIMSDNNNSNDDRIINKTEQADNAPTYWESSEWSNPYETDNEQPNDSKANNYQNTKNNQYELEQKKKSRRKPIVATLVIIVLLLATVASAFAFAFNGGIRNSLDLLLKSPKDYYAHIENNALENSVDKFVSYMKMSSASKNMGMEVSTNLSYDKDTVGALLRSSMGMSISDLESIIGIPLDSIGFDMVSAYNEEEAYNKIGLKMNNTDIIYAELFMGYASEEMLIHLPDLSPAYLKQSLDIKQYELGDLVEDFKINAYEDALNLLSSENIGDFIKRYSALIIGEVKDVTLTKDEQVTIGEITVESNLLTARFYPETLLDIYTKVLEEARNDEYILDLLALLDTSKEEYNSNIDKALLDIKDKLQELDPEKELLTMNIYVAGDGRILGRELEFLDNTHDGSTIAYYYLQQKDKGSYEFYIKDNEETKFSLTGSHTKDNGTYSGGAVLETLIRDDKGHTIYSFDIDYKDVKTVVKNNRIYNYGSFNLSTGFMMGMEIVIEYDVKDDARLSTISLNMGRSSLVTLESSAKYINDFTIPTPDENADYYDILTESNEYYSTIDIQEYISSLSNRLGLDLEGLLGSFLPF